MILNTILLLTSANLPTAAAEEQPEMIVVTSSRQAQSLTNLAESVTVLNEQLIKDVSPGHPAELLNRVPGVHVNDLEGEGHMTAIRQPITTGGVYLFLEDVLSNNIAAANGSATVFPLSINGASYNPCWAAMAGIRWW